MYLPIITLLPHPTAGGATTEGLRYWLTTRLVGRGYTNADPYGLYPAHTLPNPFEHAITFHPLAEHAPRLEPYTLTLERTREETEQLFTFHVTASIVIDEPHNRARSFETLTHILETTDTSRIMEEAQSTDRLRFHGSYTLLLWHGEHWRNPQAFTHIGAASKGLTVSLTLQEAEPQTNQRRYTLEVQGADFLPCSPYPLPQRWPITRDFLHSVGFPLV